jgi:hypothetical protein
MEQRPPWEAYSHLATLEINPLLCNPKIHHLINKSSSLDPRINLISSHPQTLLRPYPFSYKNTSIS